MLSQAIKQKINRASTPSPARSSKETEKEARRGALLAETQPAAPPQRYEERQDPLLGGKNAREGAARASSKPGAGSDRRHSEDTAREAQEGPAADLRRDPQRKTGLLPPGLQQPTCQVLRSKAGAKPSAEFQHCLAEPWGTESGDTRLGNKTQPGAGLR